MIRRSPQGNCLKKDFCAKIKRIFFIIGKRLLNLDIFIALQHRNRNETKFVIRLSEISRSLRQTVGATNSGLEAVRNGRVRSVAKNRQKRDVTVTSQIYKNTYRKNRINQRSFW